MKRFLSDLMLIPRIWRGLVKAEREAEAYRASVRAFAERRAKEGPSPAVTALHARVAARRAAAEGRMHLREAEVL